MSYEIVKSITIIDDKVYFTSASNNVSPRTFERFESEYFSNLYQKGGLEALLPEIAANVWEGNFHLYNGSKISTFLNEGFNILNTDYYLRRFLDTERASQYISDYALFQIGKGPAPSLESLQALRHDKKAVLDVCSKNPAAFNYASEEVRSDRNTALEYILKNRDKLLFQMPEYFRSDKGFALLALDKDGTTFRDLSSDLKADKDVVRLAFDSTLDRRYYEHLPDQIPESLRHDTAFMSELISICPHMHVFRTPELLKDINFTKAWLKGDGWFIDDLRLIPYKQLQDPQIRTYIYNRYKNDPSLLDKAEQILNIGGALSIKPSLDNIIAAADERQVSSVNPSIHLVDQTVER